VLRQFDVVVRYSVHRHLCDRAAVDQVLYRDQYVVDVDCVVRREEQRVVGPART
jgi:hypothetical protein